MELLQKPKLKPNFKVSNIIKNKYVLEAFVNGEEAGAIHFEFLQKAESRFLSEEIEKINIVDNIINKNKYIYLSYIVVEDKFNGKGIANELMKRFDKIFEAQNIDFVFLSACPFPYGKTKMLPLPILTQFYEKFDFIKLYTESDNVLMYKEK